MSPGQAASNAMDVVAIFFQMLDDSMIADENLSDWVNGLPPGAFMSFSDALGVLEPAQYRWDIRYFNLQKLAARRNFSKDRVDELLELRRKARAEGWAGTTASTPSPAGATTLVARPAVRDESRPSAPFVPSDGFRRRFEKVPLEQAREAMKTELGDEENTTAELRSLAAWCEMRRPDIFDLYVVDDFAQPILDAPSAAPAEEEFYVHCSWLDRNFSKKRFLGAVALRDLLRRQGKLPTRERIAATGTDFRQEADSVLDRMIDWIKTHQRLSGATFLAFGLLVVLAYWSAGRNK